ncbi:hypothetical protein FB567DRAFT_196508 [Paraphoma chrysanthemicola]|uniref:RING-type domain-containing protein n=1 Tax=Paraphoma chrysanthemicola TaxID=798071 RepID=A0A8K0QUL5_9PLEO|nr:hypothetical protein FB567DRAFT_196508 [Paraphoma chrysanthemicola]
MPTPTASRLQQSRTSTALKEAPPCTILIRPISLRDIEDEDQNCPICREHYREPPSPGCRPEDKQEWAVSVEIVAGIDRPRECCGHIMGRKCLDMHLRARGQWRNKCPICRDVWYEVGAVEDAEGREEEQAQSEPIPIDPPRRSLRIAARDRHRRSTATPMTSDRRGVNRAGREQRAIRQTRSRRFHQDLLAALDVEEGSDEIGCTLEEVKHKLEALYGSKRMTGLFADL